MDNNPINSMDFLGLTDLWDKKKIFDFLTANSRLGASLVDQYDANGMVLKVGTADAYKEHKVKKPDRTRGWYQTDENAIYLQSNLNYWDAAIYFGHEVYHGMYPLKKTTHQQEYEQEVSAYIIQILLYKQLKANVPDLLSKLSPETIWAMNQAEAAYNAGTISKFVYDIYKEMLFKARCQ